LTEENPGGISPEKLVALGLERAINERFFGSTNSHSTRSSYFIQRKDSSSQFSSSENGGLS